MFPFSLLVRGTNYRLGGIRGVRSVENEGVENRSVEMTNVENVECGKRGVFRYR